MNDPRVRPLNRAGVDPAGQYVLYWMVAARRAAWNLALERAVERAAELGKPLVVLEALRVGYRWASDRLHGFLLDGMRDNAADFAAAPVTYRPYLEPEPGAGSGLLEALAARACVVVTDDFPCFFLPAMQRAVAERLPVTLEAVDGNGLYPMRATSRAFTTAASFRRHLQKELPGLLGDGPAADPLAHASLPPAPNLSDLGARWPVVDLARPNAELLAPLAIDHAVGPTETRGGRRAALEALADFVGGALADYATARNDPDDDVRSHLSPYLHAGHIGAHEVFDAVAARDGWAPHRIADRASGSRSGWWGMSAEAEAFVDQLVTWRELGFNLCAHVADYDQPASLPAWALTTIAAHAADPRPYVYSDEELAEARTHDPLWNAAQRQLVRDGTIHNYLRMLWGKKIYEWTPSAADAWRVMVELNNKYGLDGRDPNSYSGIGWVLGRFDRAWGPERAVFGKLRYMTSASAARKLRLRRYLERYGEDG